MKEIQNVLILTNKKGQLICPCCKRVMFEHDYGKWLKRKLNSMKYIHSNTTNGVKFILHKECKRDVTEDNIGIILKRLKVDNK